MAQTQMKKLVVCGDSFSRGIGCHDLLTEPFGCLLAQAHGLEHVNYAKGSATHLNIMLQAQYALEKHHDIELLLIGNTSYDRIDWWPEDHTHHGDIKLTDVNYHQYPPYKSKSYHMALPNPLAHDPEYRGKMFTENYVGVIEYWQRWGSRNEKFDYFEKFYNEPPEKLQLLHDFALNVHDVGINRVHSMGLLTMAHNLAKKQNVKHLILTHEPDAYSKYIAQENLVHVDWMQLSRDHPDSLPSGHTSSHGHVLISQAITKKLQENHWL